MTAATGRRVKAAKPEKGAVRSSKGERTRERIKQGFVKALDERNHARVTIEDICRQADITVGGFYFHYQNQQLLLEEVIGEYVSALAASFEAATNPVDLSGSIEKIVNTFTNAYSEAPGLTRTFQQLVRTQTETAEIWRKAIAPCIEKLSNAILAEQAALSEEKANFLAASIVSLATLAFNPQYFLRSKRASATAQGADEVSQTVIALCRRLIS